MDDLSAFLKKGFQRLHQKALEKDYKQKTLKDRRDDYTYIRRKTRDTLMLQKRNIDLNNLTPICTPETERKDKHIETAQAAPRNNEAITKSAVPAQNNKRLEMLKKWKTEKEKRQLEEKKNAKPLFKICHVPVTVGLPNLENVNKQIKGKPIKKTESFKSKFAPENHTFRPPKNIVPIQMKNPKQKIQKVEPRINSNIKTMSQDSTSTTKVNSNLKSTEVKKKPATPQLKKKPEPVKKVSSSKEKTVKTRKPNKTPETKKIPKKGVMFGDVQLIDSDDEILTQDIKTKTPRKTYSKTPIKKRVAIIPNGYNDFDEDSVTADTKKINASISYDALASPKTMTNSTNGNKKTRKSNKESSSSSIEVKDASKSRTNKTPTMKNEPKRKSTNKTASSSKNNKNSDAHSSEETNQRLKRDTKNLKRSISREEIVVPAKKTPLRTKRLGRKSNNYLSPVSRKRNEESSDTDDNMVIHSRKMTASPSFDSVSSNEKIKDHEGSENTSDNNKNDVSFTISENMNKLGSTTKNRSIFYSDEEMSIKTPIRKLATPKIPRESMLKSIERNASKRMSTSTPLNEAKKDPAVYISPFVTISRGKESARKEFKIRLSSGGTVPNTPQFNRGLQKNSSPKAGAAYFSKKLQEEIDRIEAVCLDWIVFKEEIPEEVQDMVDAAIGQSKLLISKKFQQFRNLIKLCEDGTDKNMPVTCTDLHGYWDTMYMQIEDIDKRFNNLQRLKDNNWKEVLIPDKKPAPKRGRGRPKKVTAQSKLKDMIKNARLRKNNKDMVNGDGEAPLKPIEIVSEPNLGVQPASTKKRKSLIEIAFVNKEKRKLSSSPGMAMLRLSQAIKCGDGLTPSKSILKTDTNRSAKRTTKSVLFKDLEEDKENSFENLISLSPVTPRRSRRINMVT